MFVCYARQIKNIFEFWLETDFFFPHHAKQLFQNISKHELNSKQVPLWAGYPRIFQASLQTEAAAFPEIILNSLDIKYISNTAKAVRFGNFAGRSDLPGSRFWVHTCGTLQQLQDKEFPEVAGNISMTSVLQTSLLI